MQVQRCGCTSCCLIPSHLWPSNTHTPFSNHLFLLHKIKKPDHITNSKISEISSPMAASTALSATITPSQLCSSKNRVNSISHVAHAKCVNSRRMKVSCMATSIPADRVPDMGKRELLNLLLLGAISLPAGGMLLPYTYFFVPPGGGGAAGGTVAKDALGNDVVADVWLTNHGPGDRTLTQGLKGDPTYLVVENDRTLATYGINAVCTHLGCVVPWNKAENKFLCPCHGSQYNNQGRVVRGPAPYLCCFVTVVGIGSRGH